MSAKTILFNISHGFQARMLLRTRVANDLICKGFRILVVSPSAEEPYFQKEFDREGFLLRPMPKAASAWEMRLTRFRQFLLMNPRLGKTLHFKAQAFRNKRPILARIIRLLNLFLGNIPPLRNLFLWGEAKLFKGSEFDPLLKEFKPSLVVAGTPGFGQEDAHVLRAAKRHGIPSATVMLSWDNLTSKGYMGAQPDHLLVWNQVMADEARTLHNFKGPIEEVGAAQFDIYRQVAEQEDLNLPSAPPALKDYHRLLVWGTINQDIYPEQLEDLQAFITSLENEDWGQDCFLWVRLHPQTISGLHEGLKPAYQSLAGERVHVEFPPVRSKALAWDLPKEDMVHLAKLMTRAEVVLVPRSTLSIDAACAGTPVVNIAMNPDFAKGFQYTHYRKVLTCEGIWVAGSMEELLDAVRTYLEVPSTHSEGRQRIIDQQMGAYFGRAGARTAEVLAELAKSE